MAHRREPDPVQVWLRSEAGDQHLGSYQNSLDAYKMALHRANETIRTLHQDKMKLRKTIVSASELLRKANENLVSRIDNAACLSQESPPKYHIGPKNPDAIIAPTISERIHHGTPHTWREPNIYDYSSDDDSEFEPEKADVRSIPEEPAASKDQSNSGGLLLNKVIARGNDRISEETPNRGTKGIAKRLRHEENEAPGSSKRTRHGQEVQGKLSNKQRESPDVHQPTSPYMGPQIAQSDLQQPILVSSYDKNESSNATEDKGHPQIKARLSLTRAITKPKE